MMGTNRRATSSASSSSLMDEQDSLMAREAIPLGSGRVAEATKSFTNGPNSILYTAKERVTSISWRDRRGERVRGHVREREEHDAHKISAEVDEGRNEDRGRTQRL